MSLALDGSAHASANPVSSLNVALTTTTANDLIFVVVTTNGGPITNVTGSGLSFTQRVTTHNLGQDIDIWYAVAATPLAAVTLTASVTSSSIITLDAFGVSGANTGSPFDSNVSLPNEANTSPLTINTSNAVDMIIEASRGASPGIDAGFTTISNADFQAVGYKIVSTIQSGLNLSFGGGSINGAIADAIMEFALLGPNVTTTLTNVPAKAFTRKHYYNELEKIREDSAAVKALLEAMDERGRADHDFELAKAVMDNFDKNMTPSNYAKAMDARENYEKAKKARDHHYFMEVVKKAWADDEAKKKK